MFADIIGGAPTNPTQMTCVRTLAQQPPPPDDTSTRIHILGTGGVGKLVAHSLRGVPDPPPVTLLYHRPVYKKDFDEFGRVIKLKTGRHEVERSGFDAEVVLPVRKGLRGRAVPARERFKDLEGTGEIRHLVVTVKAPDTVSALTPLLHRLTPRSTILFLQNGMGTVEECSAKLFPDPATRPSYLVGVNSHGVHATSPFSVTHAGHGTIMLGVPIAHQQGAEANAAAAAAAPAEPADEEGAEVERGIAADTTSADAAVVGGMSESAAYIVQALTRVPVLAAVALRPLELRQAMLEKLAVNCLINPLTVMLDCRNCDLLSNFAISRTMVLLLAEISLVIQSLPELRGVANAKLRFSPERLQHITVSIAEKTGQNISSMLQDCRRGVRTEVEYINGYIVKRGEELGIKPVMNYMLMQMVIGKQQMIGREIENYLPTAKEPRDDVAVERKDAA